MVYKIVGNNFDQRSEAELTRKIVRIDDLDAQAKRVRPEGELQGGSESAAEGRMPDVTRLLGQRSDLQ